jgi:hypothetical protein
MNPQIVITVTKEGEIRVQANITDPIILFGVLERAKDALREGLAQQANGPQVIAAPATALAGIGR